ncbi:MAG: methyltransferase domain-containing protein [Phycisphaerales bacterium]|nr:MAG: methyltransferase domain-containing protein [Phycisphaerales bacterium]
MADYYSETLSAERLRLCYEIAPPRVQQYLQAEIDFVLEKIRPDDAVLELGCGHGRVLQQLIGRAKSIVGIDTSSDSLRLARQILAGIDCQLMEMDATDLKFADGRFDMVICIQNGISAFHVDKRKLIGEAVRVTRSGGMALFSSYAAKFWPHRLEWFRIQAAHGLIGEIDEEATGDGVIRCKDGFAATTIDPDEFASLTASLGLQANITEVDDSSIFCEIVPT